MYFDLLAPYSHPQQSAIILKLQRRTAAASYTFNTAAVTIVDRMTSLFPPCIAKGGEFVCGIDAYDGARSTLSQSVPRQKNTEIADAGKKKTKQCVEVAPAPEDLTLRSVQYRKHCSRKRVQKVTFFSNLREKKNT